MAFPNISVCILCEEARPELGFKTILLGVYGLAHNSKVFIQNFSLPVRLCFVYMGDEGVGIFKVDLKVIAPNGAAYFAPTIHGELKTGIKGTNIFFNFVQQLPGPGKYNVQLLVDDKPTPVHETTFELRQAPQNAQPQLPTVTKAN